MKKRILAAAAVFVFVCLCSVLVAAAGGVEWGTLDAARTAATGVLFGGLFAAFVFIETGDEE